MLSELLYTMFANDATISAQVSTRIYTELMPPSITRPAILLTQIDGVVEKGVGVPTGVVDVRFQVDIYAEDQATIEALRDAIIDLDCSGYSAGGSDSIISLTTFDYGRYLPEPGLEGFRYVIDLQICYGRA